jgi:hypothetical protein
MDAAHTLGILGHQGSNHGHAVTARGGDSLQVSLNTCAACWVGTGDG